MTKDEILSAEPGQLREWVADTIYTRHEWDEWPGLKHTVICQHCQRTAPKANPEKVGPYCNVRLYDMANLPDWTGDIGEAWDLLDPAWFVWISRANPMHWRTWECWIGVGQDAHIAHGDTASLAICRAYLLAKDEGREEAKLEESPGRTVTE